MKANIGDDFCMAVSVSCCGRAIFLSLPALFVRYHAKAPGPAGSVVNSAIEASICEVVICCYDILWLLSQISNIQQLNTEYENLFMKISSRAIFCKARGEAGSNSQHWLFDGGREGRLEQILCLSCEILSWRAVLLDVLQSKPGEKIAFNVDRPKAH